MSQDSHSPEVPAAEIDFGIGRVYVKGDADTSFEELIDEFDKQKAYMSDTIERLKKFDQELEESRESRVDDDPSRTFG